jgi:hypothetical protein
VFPGGAHRSGDRLLHRRSAAAQDAKPLFLVLSGCRLEHPDQPPLAADRLTTTLLVLDRAVITADCETGAVRLAGAQWSKPDAVDEPLA